MNFDISTLCCNFLFIINSVITLILKNEKKKTKKSRMFLRICLLVIFLIVNSNSHREFIKITKKSRMFLKTGFVELLISFN